MASRSVHVYFAEDIRQEASGQVTIVGIFGDTVGVGNFPVTMGRLAALVELAVPINDPLTDLAFEMRTDEGTILAQGAIGREQLKQQTDLIDRVKAKEGEDENENGGSISLRMHIVVNSIVLKGETKVRLYFKSPDHKEMRSRALRIRKMPIHSVKIALGPTDNN